ncbi:uncharacterized protein LOC107042905 [Diachasma alloeum]|uniref:uncharacterized protein LOC107042905 n=1 Tax=Diachasma alloeum TaxID=454923 RepID=UPI0007381A3D|nr:uncharacterized protein LOC107042905 [Diachasma alloeum]
MAVTQFKLPDFWSNDLELWFIHIEALFSTRNIRSDATIYGAVVAALGSDVLKEMSDILRAPPPADKYQNLKAMLLKRFTDSVDRQLYKLLTEMQLGMKKPSQLLKEMGTLAGMKASEELLRSRWLALLPVMVANILKTVANNSTLDQLAEAADSVMENHTSSQVLSTSFQSMALNNQPMAPSVQQSMPFNTQAFASSTQPMLAQGQVMAASHTPYQRQASNITVEQRLSELERTVANLAASISSLTAKLAGGRPRSRSRSRTPEPPDHCFYHQRFGARAVKCLQPFQTIGGSAQVIPSIKEERLHVYDRSSHTRFLVDSGSVVSVLPRALVKQKLQPSDFKLFAANSTSIATYGLQPITLNLGLREAFFWPFIVADVQSAIIGTDFIVHFGLMIDIKKYRLIDPLTSLSPTGELVETSDFGISTMDQHSFSNSVHEGKYSDITKPAVSAASHNPAGVAHYIVTTGPPVVDRFRKLAGEKLKVARDDINMLLELGVIRPSSSQWASPIHMVEKKLGGWRTTGDFRRLNAQTVPDRYPVPYPEDIFQHLHGKKIFSTIDLVRAYHQIEFLGMPPGLRNASRTFQRHMDNILRGLDFVGCYIDDLIVASETHEEHLQHLQQVFSILRQHKLSLNTSKWEFGKEEVTYLGYTINKDGYKAPSSRVEAIISFPRPETVTDLRRFLGMVNYYRKSIPHAAESQASLNGFITHSKKTTNLRSSGPLTPKKLWRPASRV